MQEVRGHQYYLSKTPVHLSIWTIHDDIKVIDFLRRTRLRVRVSDRSLENRRTILIKVSLLESVLLIITFCTEIGSCQLPRLLASDNLPTQELRHDSALIKSSSSRFHLNLFG
ncbi:MAG: hypothetical protein MHPSP_000717 [Paramarteilia canceri]